jgi:plasmid maintenance system antidote protein VapI
MLAERVGITEQSVSHIINNAQIMSYETSYNVAKVLECSMENLYEVHYVGSEE